MIQSTDQDAYARVRLQKIQKFKAALAIRGYNAILLARLCYYSSKSFYCDKILTRLELKSLPKRKRLQEWNEVSHNFLVGEIELVDDDGVDVVVWKEVVDAGLVSDVLEQDVQGL